MQPEIRLFNVIFTQKLQLYAEFQSYFCWVQCPPEYRYRLLCNPSSAVAVEPTQPGNITSQQSAAGGRREAPLLSSPPSWLRLSLTGLRADCRPLGKVGGGGGGGRHNSDLG